jgi:hypothetical protein
MREPFLSWEKIWALPVATGRLGMSSSAVCVERMRSRLGKPAVIPCVAGILWMQGLLAWRKCPVHTVSAMMVSLVWLSEAGVKTGSIGSRVGFTRLILG